MGFMLPNFNKIKNFNKNKMLQMQMLILKTLTKVRPVKKNLPKSVYHGRNLPWKEFTMEGIYHGRNLLW